jgi:hypothetical protein
MNRSKKAFDSVELMRSARDRISGEIEGMALEEELAWIAAQAMDDPFLKRLRDKAVQRAGSI